MKRIIVAALASLIVFATEAGSRVKSAEPRDGVYFTWTGFETTVLELRDGHFRYWFASDAKSPVDPVYPLSGDFTVAGDIITLIHPQVYRPKWAFRLVDGLATLWMPEALQEYRSDRHFLKPRRLRQQGLGSVLVASRKSAEEIWSHPFEP